MAQISKTNKFEQETQLLQIKDDECCILFDFGCYFPYSNNDILTFSFSLGEEKLDDYKINHRYPNKGYSTISRKYGRNVSKFGYPYIMKLSDQQKPMLLCINIGIKDDVMTLIFPIQTNMTKDKRFCELKLNYNFTKSIFSFFSHEKQSNGGWLQTEWSNCQHNIITDRNILLNDPNRIEDGFTLIYNNVITPHAQSLQDLFLYY